MKISLRVAACFILIPAVAFGYGGSYQSVELQRKKTKQKELQQQQQANAQGKGTQAGTANVGTTGDGANGFHAAGSGASGYSSGGAGTFAGGLGAHAGISGTGGAAGGGGGGGAAGGGGGGSAGGAGGPGELSCPQGFVSSGGRCVSASSNNNNSSTSGDPGKGSHVKPGTTVDPADRAPRGGCFVAGTPVATPGGARAIESLRVGDAVYAVDPATLELVSSRVTRVFHHVKLRSERVRVTLSNGRRLVATTVHRFYDPARRAFRPIGGFREGDRVVAIDPAGVSIAAVPPARLPAAERGAAALEPGAVLPRFKASAKELTIVSIERLGDSPTDVFNVAVEDFHDYLADGVLVHNLKPVTP